MMYIYDSEYAEFFSDVIDKNILLRSEVESHEVFSSLIGKSASNFFGLPDNHWIINGERQSLVSRPKK